MVTKRFAVNILRDMSKDVLGGELVGGARRRSRHSRRSRRGGAAKVGGAEVGGRRRSRKSRSRSRRSSKKGGRRSRSGSRRMSRKRSHRSRSRKSSRRHSRRGSSLMGAAAPVGGYGTRKGSKRSPWIKHVKAVAKRYGLSYKDALMEASKTYK